MSKITFIIGTKAELIKCMPLMLELKKQKIKYIFIHTGQHNFGDICLEFKIKKPDYVLSKEPTKSTKFWSKINSNSIFWCFSMIFKIKKLIQKLKPSYVLYHGDTMSSSVAAISSSKLCNFRKTWKNVHLEAGLRSIGEVNPLLEPFPEEISRRICDCFSDILIVPSDQAKENLRKYKKKKVIKLGNTILDSTNIIYNKIRNKKTSLPKKYVLINIHRHENLKSKERMRKIVSIIKNISIPIIFPLHDNTRKFLEEYKLMDELENMKNLKIVTLMTYSEFIFLISNCKLLLVDGGSIQEESLIFHKPCIILRMNTERPEGLESNFQFLSKLDVEKTKEKIKEYLLPSFKIKKFKNPYGEKGVSRKIIDELLK